MGAENALGSLNIPFFVFVILLLSYILWSKFFNKGNLNIKKSNQIMDILSIFIFLMTSIFGAIILTLMIVGVFSLNFDINFLYSAKEIIFGIVGIIGTLILILLINNTRNKNVEKNDLKIPALKIIKNYILIATIIASYLLTILFTPLKNFMGDSLLFSILILIFFITFCWELITNTLFKGKNPKILTKKNKIYLGIVLILIVVLSFSFLPSIKTSDIQNTRFIIYNFGGYNQESFLEQKLNFDIKNLGHIGSLPNLLVLDYSKSKIKTNTTIANNEFSLNAYRNNSERIYLMSTYSQIEDFDPRYFELEGVKDIQLKEGFIAIKFNREKFMQEKIKTFELFGVSPINLPDKDLAYKDDTGRFEECVQNNCSINIEINNSLKMPVRIKDTLLENLNNRLDSETVKNCKIEMISGEYLFEKDVTRYSKVKCNSKDSCIFEVRDTRSENAQDLFRIYFSNNNGVIYQNMNLEVPIKIKLNLKIIC